jgi:hypothetical protein
MAMNVFYIDFDVVTSGPPVSVGMDRSPDGLRLISDKIGESGLVAMVHIHRNPVSSSVRTSPKAPIWAALFERSGIWSVLGQEASHDQTEIKEILGAISGSNDTVLSTLFVVFDHSDIDAFNCAQNWASWGRALGYAFIIGASISTESRISKSESGHFDFLYGSDGHESLIHAPALILEQHSSFISYDFEDLRSLWKGRIGQIWSIPASLSSLELLVIERLGKLEESDRKDFILRYDGPAGLDVIGELAMFVDGALQTNQSLIAAWQTQEKQKTGRLELCLMNDPA